MEKAQHITWICVGDMIYTMIWLVQHESIAILLLHICYLLKQGYTVSIFNHIIMHIKNGSLRVTSLLLQKSTKVNHRKNLFVFVVYCEWQNTILVIAGIFELWEREKEREKWQYIQYTEFQMQISIGLLVRTFILMQTFGL